MFFLLVSTVVCIIALFITHWIHNQSQLDIVTKPVRAPADGPLVSIIIPARNEQDNIRRCIEKVLAQDYPNFQVLVLDDRSTDATPAILAELSKDEPRLVVLFGEELPEGWAGKPHALHQAAKAATGQWLCFVDADTFLEPNAISAAMNAAAETGADLYSMMTLQIMETFWERVIQPVIFTAISTGFSARKVNDPKQRAALANGQFILIRSSVYDAVGGHEAIKNQIVEDKALAEQVKWNGYRILMTDGYALAKTRMYTSLATIWEGWTKNIYLGLKDSRSSMLLGVFGAFVAIMLTFFMPLWPVLGLVWLIFGGGTDALLVLAQSALFWGIVFYLRARVAQNMEISGWYALTAPLGAAVFGAMMFTSTWKSLSGRGITWKGRTYDPKVVR